MEAPRAWTLSSRLLAMVVVVGASPRAHALPAIQDVLGVYDGFYQSAMNPDDRGPVQVMVTQQLHRRFMGMLAGVFPFDGTIAASGEFAIVGRGGGAAFVVQGTARFMGDGSVFVQSRYRFRQRPASPGAANPPDNGLLILVRDTGAEDTPSVIGLGNGAYQSSVAPPIPVRCRSRWTAREVPASAVS